MTGPVRAGFAHAKTLAALHAPAFPHEPWDEGDFATLLAQPGVTALLDPRGGFVLWRIAADEAEILTLAVIPRRQGIGTALMRAAIEAAGTAGAVAMYLEVAAGNEAALGLYRNLGFNAAGRRNFYYPTGEDALVLRLTLRNP